MKSKVTIEGPFAEAYQMMLDQGMINDRRTVEQFIGLVIQERDPKKIFALVTGFFESTRVKWQLGPQYSIDCKSGCGFCCYLHVDIFDFEAIALRDYIKTKYSKAEIAEIKARAYDKHQRTKDLDQKEKQQLRIACPLLGKDHKCMAYESRPLNCRKMFSADVNFCREGYENPKPGQKNLFWQDPWSVGLDIETGLTIGYLSKTGTMDERKSKIKSLEEHLVNKL